MRKLILAASMMFVSLAAAAQTADELAKKNALQRFEEGVVLVDKGQYEEARLKFVQAYAVIQKPTLLFNLAVTEQKTNRAPSAAGHFRKLLKDPTTPANLRTKAEKMMAEIAPTLAHVVVTAPDGADVSVDGAVVGRAPLEDPVDVTPGAHDFGIRLQDRHVESHRDMKPGDEQRIELRFVDTAPTVTATATTAVDAGAPPGHDELARPTVGYVVPLVVTVLGVAGIGTGGGLALASQGAHDDARTAGQSCATSNPTACTNALNAKGRADSLATGAIASYIIGGVLVATGLVTFFVWPKSRVHVDGAVSPTSAALNVMWTF